MPGSTGRHSDASKVVDAYYGRVCLFCGETNNITKAHLVAGNSAVDYSSYGVRNGYRDELDIKSARNFIPLCGTKGIVGTCHDAFDRYLLTMIFDPLKKLYRVFCFDSSFAKYTVVNNKELIVPEKCRPYTRLLTWRTRKCMVEHGYRIAGDLSTELTAINLSDASKKASESDDSGDDAEVDEEDDAGVVEGK